MSNEKRTQAVSNALQKRIRTFSRIEKAFYGVIIVTAITMAISIIFIQSRNLQVQQDISDLNSKISQQETKLNNAKQEVNELSRRDRIVKIAQDAGLSNQNDNIQKVE
ncbi:cell division protein FtsL [Streptococcus urinalis FB127-CNA-2]|uniref:Cell division protein FtsL n=1 Tax=Streptococcus urinalis 2285-97 TaxID=764291 RepID=G5KCN5_9STRE|nr:cell division protein FtsL [Streptococcus urinalis]EHJ55668.1 cell division protein FtsL [Streptococcus urinalis 2285-97]EKS19785.1 cell division protein FtsL [Streptococcus urinalis FB127-CNA-2]VEF31361.1 cell division protein [Streptococcus urinalis]